MLAVFTFNALKQTIMKKIIVPVDFSETAANAALFAGNLALFYGAEIWLYHAYEIPVGISEYPFPIFDLNEMKDAADHELGLFSENLANKLRAKIQIQTRCEMGVFVPGLQEFCDEIKPDLVIMGLSGSNTLSRLIVGSNTIKVVHQLEFPVLVIPPKASFVPVRKIGFACDYKQVAESTPVSTLAKFVSDFNASLYVLNVDFEDRDFTPDKMQETFDVRWLFKDITPQFKSIENANVAEGINQFAKQEGLDWITVIPKKHNLVQKIFGRSQSKELMYHTVTPILCLHQP